jgi:general secretion pathway protein D
MKSRIIAALALTSLATGTLPAQLAPQAPLPGPRPVADLIVNMRDVEISAVAEQISRITGRTLILDPSVSGKVNVTSAEPLSRDGVWELFRSVLRVHGFAAVRAGRAWRIIPQANAIRDTGSAARGGGAQEVVTRLVRLQNLNADAAVRVFRPLVASFGTIEAIASPNAIVVTDFAENVRRIERLAQALDRGGSSAGFDTITLRYATARDVATAIQGLFGDPASSGGAKVVADDRSNIVIVRGDPRAIADARRIARSLDLQGGGTPVTRVFRLSNADAETVTEVLRGLMGDGSAAATNPVARSLTRNRLTSAFGTRGSGGGLGQFGGGGGGGNPLGAAGLAGALGGGGLGGTGGLGGLATLPAQGDGAPGGGSGGQSSAQGFSTPELTIQPAPELNAVVVRGTPAAIAGVESLITELDVRRPQVVIEAAIVEITGDDAEALGIQLGIGAAAVSGADGAATSFTNLGLPLRSVLAVLGVPAAGAVLADGLSANVGIGNNFSILVQALGQSTRANLLSTPSLTTLDNSPAEFVVGQNVPFRTGSFATDGNTLAPLPPSSGRMSASPCAWCRGCMRAMSCGWR